MQPPLDAVLLHRVHRPLRDARLGRHERDLEALAGEQLGQHAAHVVVVVVEQHDALAARPRAGHQVVGCQHLHARRRSGSGGRASGPTPSARQRGAGRDGDVVEAVLEHLVGGQLAPEGELDVRELLELPLAVVDAPGSTPRARAAAPRAAPGRRARRRPRPAPRRSRACRAPAPPPARPGRRRRPAPSLSVVFGRIRSGCQPRRHSSPMVGFWVQRIGVMVKSPETQMLQPMHSRMSSSGPPRSSSAGTGRRSTAAPRRSCRARPRAPSAPSCRAR